MVRQVRAQPPPRPHSADFLEYEAARRPQQQPAQCERPPDQPRHPQRPKSSLDIVNPSDTTNDGYFYSEERYVNLRELFERYFSEYEGKKKRIYIFFFFKQFILFSIISFNTLMHLDQQSSKSLYENFDSSKLAKYSYKLFYFFFYFSI